MLFRSGVCVLDYDMKWMCCCSSRAIEYEDLCFKKWEDIKEVLEGKGRDKYPGYWGSLQEEVGVSKDFPGGEAEELQEVSLGEEAIRRWLGRPLHGEGSRAG